MAGLTTLKRRDLLNRESQRINTAFSPAQILGEAVMRRQARRRVWRQVRAYNRRTARGVTRVRSHNRRFRAGYVLPKALDLPENRGFFIGKINNLRARRKVGDKLEPVTIHLAELLERVAHQEFPDPNDVHRILVKNLSDTVFGNG